MYYAWKGLLKLLKCLGIYLYLILCALTVSLLSPIAVVIYTLYLPILWLRKLANDPSLYKGIYFVKIYNLTSIFPIFLYEFDEDKYIRYYPCKDRVCKIESGKQCTILGWIILLVFTCYFSYSKLEQLQIEHEEKIKQQDISEQEKFKKSHPIGSKVIDFTIDAIRYVKSK